MALFPWIKNRWLRRMLILTLIIAVGTYLAWWVVLYNVQDSMLFPRKFAPPAAVKTRFEASVMTVPIQGGTVEAWFVPSDAAKAGKPGPVVVFFHGNAELIDYQDSMVAGYRRLGYSLLLPEFRGYGRSAGEPSQEGIGQDMVAFYDQLVQRPDVDKQRIVFHGRSLGGGVAADLAAKRTPAAMILESTFGSVASMAWGFAAPPLLVKHPFRTDRVLAKFDKPLLIFHGSDDDLIPVAQGRRLRDAANGKARYIEYPCKHNDFPGVGNYEKYWGEIGAFLGTLG